MISKYTLMKVLLVKRLQDSFNCYVEIYLWETHLALLNSLDEIGEEERTILLQLRIIHVSKN